MSYFVTKEFPHSLGLSCVYRNHNTDTHCSWLHGYALAFSVTLHSYVLNSKHWVYDFGAFKDIKQYLVDRYDHTLLVAKDDPYLEALGSLDTEGLARVHVVSACSVEVFAEDLFRFVRQYLIQKGHTTDVLVTETKCSEHGGNTAVYRGPARND